MKTSFKQLTQSFFFAVAFVGVMGSLLASPTMAQVKKTESKKPAQKKEDSKDKEDSKKDDAKTKRASEILAITGADIHTVTNGIVRQGTILIEDGKIKDIGINVEVPKGAKVIDATGKIISPGFVAISMRRIAVRGTPTGKNKIEDELDPFDQNMKYALGVGITTGCIEMSAGGGRGGFRSPESPLNIGEPAEIFPGLERPTEELLTEKMLDYGDLNTALCPCCGLPVLPTEPIFPARPSTAKPRTMAVVKMAYGNVGSMLTKESVFYNPAPGALNGALNRHNWRLEIIKAQKAIKAEAEAAKASSSKSKTSAAAKATASKSTTKPKTASTAKKPAAKPKANPEIVKLLKGESRMRVRSDAYDEISDLTDLAQEYGYDLVIEGGTEAWALSEKLSKAGVEVIYTPRRRREPVKGREDSSGSHFESPMMFENAGIPFATAALSNSISMGGLAGRDLTSLPLEAAFAIRGGASDKAALESLTIIPARMMGLDDRIGSIEVGKDADLLILNGEPLDYKTYVEQAIVSGKVSYDRAKDRVFPVYERED